MTRLTRLTFGLLLQLPTLSHAQAPNASRLHDQEAAMRKLSFLDGEWAGPAEANEPRGIIRMTQTERSASLLGGTVRLIEGRSFDAKGATIFNALGMVSFDPINSRYSITSYASGYGTTAELTLTDDGFTWDVPAGPSAKLHFVATVRNGVWSEVGDYVGADGRTRRTFRMTVKRLRPTNWLAGQVAHFRK